VINDLIKRLRKAADALDGLLDVSITVNTKAARLIGNKVEQNLKGKKRGKYKLKGKHWTQTSKGRKKMSNSMKKMWAKRNEKA